MALGLGLLAHLVLALGLAGLLSPAVVAAVVLCILAACRLGRRHVPERRSPEPAPGPGGDTRRSVVIVIALAALVAALPIVLLPLYPPTTWDATSYHRASAKLYVQNGGVVLTPYLRFAVFPQTNDMLFTFALLFWNDIGAQLVQFLMMLLAAAMTYAWGRDLGSPRVGLWAAALWLGSPVVLYLGAVAYIDVGLTLFVTCATYAFFKWAQEHDESELARRRRGVQWSGGRHQVLGILLPAGIRRRRARGRRPAPLSRPGCPLRGGRTGDRGAVVLALNRRRGRDYVLYALGEENMAYFADGQFMGDWFGPGPLRAHSGEDWRREGAVRRAPKSRRRPFSSERPAVGADTAE